MSLTSINFINPINLGGKELENAKVQTLTSIPTISEYVNQLFIVNNVLYYNNGTAIINLSSISITNVVTDSNHTTIESYIESDYVALDWNEGDVLVLTTATDPSQRTWINLGTDLGTSEDFASLSSAYDETEIKAMFSAGTGLSYSNGVFSIPNQAITEAMLSTIANAKLNTQGLTVSLAATGVPNVSYSDGVYTITHNMNTRGVAVVMRDSSAGYVRVPTNDKAPTLNTVTISFTEQPVDNQYKVTIFPDSKLG